MASSSNIYFNTGSVGIGSSAPTRALDVNGGMNVTGNIYSNVTGNTSIMSSTSKSVIIAAGTTGTATVNVYSELGVPSSAGCVLVELTIAVYGGSGTGSGLFKVIAGGYGGHSYGAQGGMHPYSVIVNSLVNGTFSYINNTAGVYGVSITNTGASEKNVELMCSVIYREGV